MHLIEINVSRLSDNARRVKIPMLREDRGCLNDYRIRFDRYCLRRCSVSRACIRGDGHHWIQVGHMQSALLQALLFCTASNSNFHHSYSFPVKFEFPTLSDSTPSNQTLHFCHSACLHIPKI